jgi:hypothetical protein
MTDDRTVETPRRRYRWPWFLLAGVVLFFILSTMWMMVAVERVKRNKASTMEMTNSHQTSSAPAKP